LAGNQQIISADPLAGAFQFRGYLTRMGIGIRVQLQHFQPRGELFHFNAVAVGSRGLRRSVKQLVEDDCGNAETIRFAMETLFQGRPAISQHANAEVRVQHVTKH
jgi:hypothetical protein